MKIIKDSPKKKAYKQKIANKKVRMKDNIIKDKYELMDNGEYIDAVDYIEEHYPETSKEFLRIQKEQYELFCKKQMDYGPSNIAMGSGVGKNINTRLSLVGLIVRTNDKIQRLLNLVVNNNREAQNEPIEDAFKDLSVYGIIAQIVKNGKWGI